VLQKARPLSSKIEMRVRGRACCRFSEALKIHVFHLFIESGSKLPHSESLALKKLCGISRDGGGPRIEYMIQFANPRL
jgi:hypothetical protein